jgi:hypothetical protein
LNCISLVVGDSRDAEEFEYFSGNVALQAAKHLRLRQSFALAPLDVDACPRITSQPHKRYDPQRSIRVAVASPIESVTILPARRRVDGGDPAQSGEGGLMRQTFRVVARGDEEGSSDINPHSAQRQKLWRPLFHKDRELIVERSDFSAELMPSLGEPSKHSLGSGRTINRRCVAKLTHPLQQGRQ